MHWVDARLVHKCMDQHITACMVRTHLLLGIPGQGSGGEGHDVADLLHALRGLGLPHSRLAARDRINIGTPEAKLGVDPCRSDRPVQSSQQAVRIHEPLPQTSGRLNACVALRLFAQKASKRFPRQACISYLGVRPLGPAGGVARTTTLRGRGATVGAAARSQVHSAQVNTDRLRCEQDHKLQMQMHACAQGEPCRYDVSGCPGLQPDLPAALDSLAVRLPASISSACERIPTTY